MSRENLVNAVVAVAKNLGWTGVEADDAGTSVTLLVSAPGATEQMVEGALHELPVLLKALGGPELYPAVEEYDVGPTSAAEVLHEDVEKPGLVDFGGSNLGSLEAARRINGAQSKTGLKPKEVAAMIGTVDRETQAPLVARPQQLLQVGSYVVTGIGLHSGPFRREFDDEDKALDFAQKCQLRAVSPAYAGTIRIEYPAA